MTDMTRQYSAAASRARNAVDKTAGFWTRSTGTMMDLLPPMPQVDLVLAIESYFSLMQRTVEINRRLAVRWAEAAATLSGVVRETAESAGDVVREKAEAAGNVAREQAEQAEQELARRARQAEREQARRAHEGARGRHEGLTKARAERPAGPAGAAQNGQHR